MLYRKLYKEQVAEIEIMQKQVAGLKKHLRTEKIKNKIYQKKLYMKIYLVIQGLETQFSMFAHRKENEKDPVRAEQFRLLLIQTSNFRTDLSKILSDIDESLNCIK